MTLRLKYLSLFSGIGGFEVAIHNVFPGAECIGFSEIDKHALKVYTSHFPTHNNLGDVTKITREDIALAVKDGCDLVVGGFPCQNLSSLSRFNKKTNTGLHGPKSGLFWDMLGVLRWVVEYSPTKVFIIIENNASMKKTEKLEITSELSDIFTDVGMTELNAADFGVQTRRRLYWTNFILELELPICSQTWDDVLDPLETCTRIVSDGYIKTINKKYSTKYKTICKTIQLTVTGWIFVDEYNVKYRSRWQMFKPCDTRNKKSSCMNTKNSVENWLLDYRDVLTVRYFNINEIERLFFLPDNWVWENCSISRAKKLLGNTVVVGVIEYLLKNLKIQIEML